MTVAEDTQAEAPSSARTRPCAFCGRPVAARRPTGRPPRYCPAEERDCQARARAERITARAAEVTGGAVALRQTVLDLTGQLDEAWEPVQDLAEAVRTSRELLAGLRDELIARVEQAEQDAAAAVAAKEEAEQRAVAAEAARDEALRQTQAARTERTEALRARDDAETARQDALRARERLLAERDAAREQAQQLTLKAEADVAGAHRVADARVEAADRSAAEARETAATLRGELTVARERLDEQRQRAETAESRVEQVRGEAKDELARVTADAERKTAEARVEARSEIDALRAEHERRLTELSRLLGTQQERADRHRDDADRHAAVLRRIGDLLTTPREATGDQDGADVGAVGDKAGERDDTRAVVDAVAALLRGAVNPDPRSGERTP